MNRRRFVFRTTTVASVTLAGWLGVYDGSNNGDEADSRNTTMTHANDANCPIFDEMVDEHVCSHGENQPNAPVALRPEATTWAPTGNGISTFSFSLVNQSGSGFDIDTDAWTIRRKRKGSWTTVGSSAGTRTTTAIGPSDEHTWSLSREQHPTPHAPATTFIVALVKSGTYALTVSGTLSVSGQTVECTALFEAK